MSLIVDTTTVPVRDRFGFWASEHRRVLHPLELRRPGDGPFLGRIRAHRIGPVTLYRIEGEASAIERTPRLVAQSDPEELQITHLVRGRFRIEQDRRVVGIGAGDVSAYETSHPYQVTSVGPFELLLFALPRAMLGEQADAVCRRTATRVDGGSGAGAVAGPFLRGLADRIEDGSLDAAATGLSHCVVDLAQVLFVGGAPRISSTGLFPQVVAYVDAHLGDRDLGPRSVAAAHFVSARQLHKIFAAEGHTVAGWIRDRRLDAVRRDLADPALADRPIGALAAARGFTDAPHFSRLFRERHGCSPREFRARYRGTGSRASQVS